MALPIFLLKLVWKFTEISDNRRLAGQTYPDDVCQVNDIEYMGDGHKYHKLDVYYPQNAKGKLPVIVDIHGGGWFYGDKELNKNYCLHLAQRGFVVFNISYRLCTEVTVKEQLQDCMQALKTIGGLLKDYPCDKRKIFLTGDSAGGQLAGFAAAACESKKIRKVYDTVNPDLAIKALALVSPVSYLKPSGLMKAYMSHVVGKKYKNEKYAKHVNFDKVLKECKDYPPTILFTSLLDVIALSQTKHAYKDLKKKKIRTKLNMKYNPTLMHVYQVLDPERKASKKAIDDMVNFFKKNS